MCWTRRSVFGWPLALARATGARTGEASMSRSTASSITEPCQGRTAGERPLCTQGSICRPATATVAEDLPPDACPERELRLGGRAEAPLRLPRDGPSWGGRMRRGGAGPGDGPLMRRITRHRDECSGSCRRRPSRGQAGCRGGQGRWGLSGLLACRVAPGFSVGRPQSAREHFHRTFTSGAGAAAGSTASPPRAAGWPPETRAHPMVVAPCFLGPELGSFGAWHQRSGTSGIKGRAHARAPRRHRPPAAAKKVILATPQRFRGGNCPPVLRRPFMVHHHFSQQ